jgi:predicted nucleic acid-binding Zn ribbon protein
VSAGVSHVASIDEGLTEAARALSTARQCTACGRALKGRQRGACSARCRASASRRRRDAAIRTAIVQAVELVAIDPAKAREHLAVALCFLAQNRD